MPCGRWVPKTASLSGATDCRWGVAQRTAPDTVYSAGNAYTLPGNQAATDLQAGVFHTMSPEAKVYATVAQVAPADPEGPLFAAPGHVYRKPVPARRGGAQL
jgi:hypothetical protein